MRCKKVKRNLTAFLDGELPGRLGDRMEEHLALCANCEAERKALERLRHALEGMEAPAVVPPVSADAILRRAGLGPVDAPVLTEKRRGGRDRHFLPSRILGFRPAAVLATGLAVIVVWKVYPFLRTLPLPTDEEIYIAERVDLFENLELIQDLSLLEGLESKEGRDGELS